MTARQVLQDASHRLREAGVPDPEYDAAVLLSLVTGKAPLELRSGMTADPTEDELREFQTLLARRISREPLQYIEGGVAFNWHHFSIHPGVLIPRPETGLLAEWAEQWLSDWIRSRLSPPEAPFSNAPRPSCLDLCCGSGCLGLSVQANLPQAHFTLTDLSPEAMALTRENAERLGLALDCEILQGDLFAPVAGRKFDLILSNPPYIPSRDCDTLQPEVLREPRLALDGGADGLVFYRRIAREVPGYLNPGGALMMEMGMGEASAIEQMLLENGAVQTEIRKDLAGMDRMIFARYESFSM